jgi:hypothetical protein
MTKPSLMGVIKGVKYYVTQTPVYGAIDEVYLSPEELVDCLQTNKWPLCQGSNRKVKVDVTVFNADRIT